MVSGSGIWGDISCSSGNIDFKACQSYSLPLKDVDGLVVWVSRPKACGNSDLRLNSDLRFRSLRLGLQL